jgi:hAT family C-terminal dimerisation region
MFDALPSFAAPRHDELRDEFSRYLSTDIETVDDVLLWWIEHRASFPCLSRMALDYLTIPGTFLYDIILVDSELIVFVQLHQLQSSVYSARVVSCFLTSETVYLLKRLVHSCASAIGVNLVLLRIQISPPLQ